MIIPRRPANPSEEADLAEREDPYNAAQASRIYFLPNLMTAGNLCCGFISVLHCIQARLAESSDDGLYRDASAADHYRYSVWLIFGAAAFDALDGRLARMGGRESLFGAEFDSLADVVSFGMAPALLMFFLILSPSQGIPWFRDIGGGLGFVYLLCAAIRLARYNVITNPLLHTSKKDSNKDFVGLPVPAAAATVASVVLFLLKLADMDKVGKHFDFALHVLTLALPFLMALVAFLMVSTFRYPSGKTLDLQTQTRVRPFIGILALIGLVVFFKSVSLLPICFGYVFYGILRSWWRSKPVVRNSPNSP